VRPLYAIKALDESTWDAFAALVEANNGVFGGCWCLGFHEEGAFRERRREQFGAPREVPRIKSLREYEKGLKEPPDWRIACNFVGKGRRRKGVATAGLAGALALIAGLGGGTVEGYPEDAASVPAGFLFNGALSTYEQLGFTRDRKIGKHRWVVTKRVPAA